MPYADSEVARLKTIERLRRLRKTPGYSTAKNAAWNAKNQEKRLAHKAVERAVKSGVLVPGACECGCKNKVEAHHDDYSKPLDVRWLCKQAHEAVHH